MAVARSLVWNPAGVAASGNVAIYEAAANNIGAAADDRVIVAFVATALANSGPTELTIDFGFGPIVMNAGTLGNQGSLYIRAFWLPVSIGTQAEFRASFGATNPSATQNHMAVYRVTGATLVGLAQNVVNDTDADPISTGALTVGTGGGLLVADAHATAATARTWAGSAEDLDVSAGGFRFGCGSTITAGSVTTTVSGSNQEDATLAYVNLAAGTPTPIMRYVAAANLTVGAPSFGTPELVGPKILEAVSLTVAGLAIGTAPFTQIHVLEPVGLTVAALALGTGTLTQHHVLVPTSLHLAGAALPAPDLTPTVPVIELDATPLQVAALSIPAAALTQHHVLAPTELHTAAPSIGVGTLNQSHALAAPNIVVAAPAFTAPSIGQLHALIATGFVVGPPSIPAPTVSSGIVLILGDYPLDHGLAEFSANVDKILVCSALPTSYADALEKELGEYDFGAGNAFGAPFDGSPGRKVTCAEINGGIATAPGQVVCWAAIDSANSRLFARGPLNGGGALAVGQSWGLDSFTIHLTGS